MELQDFGPIAQAESTMKLTAENKILTGVCIAFGAVILTGYLLLIWKTQPSNFSNKKTNSLKGHPNH